MSLTGTGVGRQLQGGQSGVVVHGHQLDLEAQAL
jgi:hypothetical protein